MRFHIFPAGPMCSLRRALKLWLLPAFVVVAAASAALSYWSYGRMVDTFMDSQMVQLAASIAGQEQAVKLPALTPQGVQEGTYVVQVFDAEGQPQASTWPGLGLPLQQSPGFHDVQQADALWRVYTAGADTPGRLRVQVVQSGAFRHHVAVEHAGAAMVPLAVLLPLAMIILWGVTGAVSRALREIAAQASAQDEHNIAELPLSRVPEEIAPLVMSFNSLLARLRDAFATQRRFVQDAAHELRTPITAIGLQLENLRGEAACGKAAHEFAQLEAGVQRAQRLVDQLLKLSRQEANAPDGGTAAVDVQALLHESINGLIVLADQRRIDLGLVPCASAQPLLLRCQSADLRSALDNLIDNALRYTPEGGVVDVRVLDEGGRMAVEVVDTGPGIPEQMLPRVFDRFFRVPGSDVRGSGLGLAIARSAAQRCGLRISLRNRSDRSGLVARVDFA